MVRSFPPMEFGPSDNELADATFADYAAVGQQILAWAQGGPTTWPQTIDDLRTALAGHLHIPASVKRLKVIQSDDSNSADTEFILRLPAKNQVTESETLAAAGNYGKPPVIEIIYLETDTVQGALSKLDLFHCRVADYTMRQCR